MSWLLAALAIATVAQGAYIAMVLTRGEVLGPTSPAPTVPPPAAVIPPPPVDPLVTTGSGAASPDPAAASASAIGAAAAAPAIVPTGTADIRSTPPGARVTVDGEERGVTPLLVSLTEGLHSVVINDGRASTTRTVDIAAGALITVSAELGPPPPTAGWVSFVAPFEMQIVEDGDLLGTTRMARLMLPAGRHRIDLVNGPTHFKTTVTVNVQPGRTTKVPVAVPDGSISINALPWANVILDGKDLGATPIATISVPIGTHELILRHPKLGDRRQTVIVPANEPLRLVVDLR